MMKKASAIILLSFVFLGMAFADVKFPSPKGFVNDFAGVLTAQEKQELASISQGLKQKTGAELAVAVVKTVEPLDSKLYAVKLFEKWKIGEKGKDNGVLILLAMEEGRVEIEVGYGLEGVLTDALAGSILDAYAMPALKEGKIGVGLVDTAKAISKVVAQEEIEIPAPTETKPTAGVPGQYLLYIIIGVIILGLVLRKGGSIIMGILGVVWGSEAGIAGAIIGGLLGLFFGFWGLMFLGRGGGMGGGRGFGGGRSGGGGAGRGW